MTQYLISFNEGAMTFPEAELPEVSRDCTAVIREAYDAGVFVFSGGLTKPAEGGVVATDGTVTETPPMSARDYIGGFTIVDVPTREEALYWGARIAAACRCAQEVREFLPDPTVAELLGRA